MSYSDIISSIDSHGFFETMTEVIEQATTAGKEVECARKQLKDAEFHAEESTDNLKILIKYAGDHCDKYILDDTVPGKIILRTIEASCLWEIVYDHSDGSVQASSRVCNVKA